MKSLSVLQGFNKAGKVISIIMFVISIVGFVTMIISGLALYTLRDYQVLSLETNEEEKTVMIDEMKEQFNVEINDNDTFETIMEKLFENALGENNIINLNYISIVAACFQIAFVCIAVNIKSLLAKNFFNSEIKAGTPFNKDINKKLLKLGISFIAISYVTSGIITLFINLYNNGITEVANKLNVDLSSMISIETGIIILGFWLIIKCAIDIMEEKNDNANSDNQDNNI